MTGGTELLRCASISSTPEVNPLHAVVRPTHQQGALTSALDSTAGTGARETRWWQRAVIYQVYPRSFQDSNDDGIGDLAGVTRRLPYLKELGVDAIWLSPIFPSPMRDFGYDISAYTDIDPVFGTLGDFDVLVAAAHDWKLKVLLDLVPNHTSDQHPWFAESRSSRDNPKRHWYLWRDPAPDGGPPNNWLSPFGGSAWELDQRTGQYYYHAFLREQPDLNWRNPDVRAAIHGVMRFWLARGVDGFRVDVIWHLLKDEQFRDNPVNPNWTPGNPENEQLLPIYTTDLPEVHDAIAGLRGVVDEFDDRVLIGEIYLPFERLVAYYGRDLGGVHLPFNFTLLRAPWHARTVAQLIDEYELLLPAGGWPNWVLGNHDCPRIATRVGPEQSRVAAMLLLTLRGTPTIYYGDELGMIQVLVPAERVSDPLERNMPGFGLGRDGARTPMQWDSAIFGGFSVHEPWLPLADDFSMRNVFNQAQNQDSILNLYRRLISLRRRTPALVIGSYRRFVIEGDVLVFVRQHRRELILVALNFGSGAAVVDVGQNGPLGRILLSSGGSRDGEPVGGRLELQGNEGLVIAPETDWRG
jgi:alpha-glucosidase